jgi:hypothetical protein
VRSELGLEHHHCYAFIFLNGFEAMTDKKTLPAALGKLNENQIAIAAAVEKLSLCQSWTVDLGE